MTDFVTFLIEQAARQDGPELYALENALYDPAWTMAMIEEVLASPQSIVLTARSSDHKLLGASMGRLVADEFELYKLSVYPKFQRRGLGLKLLQAGLNHAHDRGAVRAFLEVRAGNLAAQALYYRMGFTLLSRRSGYYGESNEDALVMKLNLPLEIRL